MKLSWTAKTKHGRKGRSNYEKGETPARYGVAKQLEDGSYMFMNDYGTWHSDHANFWVDPPYHYLNDSHGKLRDPSAFIVNFNKPNSPKPSSFIL